VLGAGGSLRVRALEADGTPIAGESISLALRSEDLPIDERSAKTPADGVASFDGLATGHYRASSWDERSSRWLFASADIEPGAAVEVELRAPDLPLAVAGRVVDAGGRGLEDVQVFVTLGDTSTTTVTDEHGEFSVGSAERGDVHVAAAVELWTDRFEPAELDVPSGTRDVVLRQVAARAVTTLGIEIVDRSTLQRIPDAMVLGFIEPARDFWTKHGAPAGVATIELKLYDDVGLAIEAVGYRQRILRAAELARDLPAGELVRVILEPGLARTLEIYDDDTGAPVIAARVLDGERLVATSDGEGRAVVELPTCPAELRIRAAGHADAVWICKDWLGYVDAPVVWMKRQADEPR
jgi:hypothetical protein